MEQFMQFVVNNWYLWLILFVILGFIFYYETSSRVAGIHLLTPQEVVYKMNHEKAVIVDIRHRDQFAEGHIINALHIAPEDLDRKIKKLNKHKNKPIIVVCKLGQDSPKFAARLQQQGIEDVFALKGGVRSWREADLPLINKSTLSKGEKNE